ncbi:hypothetical protein FB451DRAFT_1400740 [Mycena latifolia]|nr:hypothetical protein FB451DRAFT_1400740 [Mycena latifolia]
MAPGWLTVAVVGQLLRQVARNQPLRRVGWQTSVGVFIVHDLRGSSARGVAEREGEREADALGSGTAEHSA